MKSSQLLQKISVDEDPGAILYDEKRRLVYGASYHGMAGTLMDPVVRKVVGAMELGRRAGIPRRPIQTQA